MPNKNRVRIDGQNRDQKQNVQEPEPATSHGHPMAGAGDDQQTGAAQRPASGYPEQNPRREQHQPGGGIDEDEVGNDFEDADLEPDDLESHPLEFNDLAEPGGFLEDSGFDQHRADDDEDPEGSGTKALAGFVREQGGGRRARRDSRG
jgi:hypothetical protein